MSATVLTSDGYNYPSEPRQQVVDLLALLDKPSSILDIGAGFGNNCIPLLEQGHAVTVTETNREALAYLRGLRKKYSNKLTVVEAPIQSLDKTKQYDAVVCTMVLHFLTPTEAKRATAAIQAATRSGGYNIITTYLAGQEIGSQYTWLLQPNELPGFYKTWHIIAYEETYPFGLKRVRTAKQLARWLLGRKGFKAARLIARK